MAELTYNEIRQGKIIVYNNEPCLVLDSHVARTQQRKPQNQVKLKSLMGGRTYNETFRSSDSVHEAEVGKKEVKFLYENKGEYWFVDPENPKDRFQLDKELMGDAIRFLKVNDLVTALTFGEDEDEKVISVKLPIKMDLIVKEAPPSTKGDTRTGGNKVVTLENGATINVPLFIEAGEKIRVNTETGEYVERVND